MKKVPAGHAVVKQKGVQNVPALSNTVASYMAQVTAVHGDRYTCDVKTVNGTETKNIPVLAKNGLINGEVFGEYDLPAVEDWVTVIHIGNTANQPAILNMTIYPYLMAEYGSAQVPVSSVLKTFTKKLLEEGTEGTYKRVFKSGASIEIQDDGTIVLETPSGSVIEMDETTGINVTDKNGNSVQMDATGITLKTGDAVTWQPNTVPVCLFSGAPHGGATGGIIKLKGN